MKCYEDVLSGARFAGRTDAAVVVRMREQAWMGPGKGEYMREVAARVQSIFGEGRGVVRTESAGEFVADLCAVGLLRPCGG